MAPLDTKGIPLPIFRAVKVVEKKYLEAEGIYRVSGALKLVEQLIKTYDSGTDPDLEKFDPFVISGTLKRFLTLLPEPLMSYELHDSFVAAQRTIKDKTLRRDEIIRLIEKLPELNRNVFYFIVKHLKVVSEHREENKMGPSNLAIVFGPTLFRSKDVDPYRMLTETGMLSGIVQNFLNDFDLYFGDMLSERSDNIPENNLQSPANNSPQPPLTSSSPPFKVDQHNHNNIDSLPSGTASSEMDLRRLKQAINRKSTIGLESLLQSGNSVMNNRQSVRRTQRKSVTMVGIQGEAVESADVQTLIQDIVNDVSHVDLYESARHASHEAKWKKISRELQTSNIPSHQDPSCISLQSSSPVDNDEEKSLRLFIASTQGTPSTPIQEVVEEETSAVELANDNLQAPLDLEHPLESVSKRIQANRLKHKRPDDIDQMSRMQLDEERRILKREIKHFEQEWATKHQQKRPSREDKLPLMPIYERYQQVRKKFGETMSFSSIGSQESDSSIASKMASAVLTSTAASAISAINGNNNSPLRRLLTMNVDGSAPMLSTAFARRQSMNVALREMQDLEDSFTLHEKKKELKKKILEFKTQFRTENNGRIPTKSDRPPVVQQLYSEYQLVKTKLAKVL